MAARDYDLIVIGSGPGGASLAHRLAPTGARILLIERGGYLPRSPANWDAARVFIDRQYQARERWHRADGRAFAPGLHYFVGGNSKVYGAALLRLRERDFGPIEYPEGLSPAWPLRYGDFEPWYAEAERLYQVHGARGEDPNEPPANSPYPHPAVSHEPPIETLAGRLRSIGLHPFHLPLGILLQEHAGGVAPSSTCIRCHAFDGFPCPLDGKADAQVICVDPALARHPNLALLTGACALRLSTDATGRRIVAVEVLRGGERERYTASVFVVACGALSSELMLLRSASDQHPAGLANGSGLVGRNYMRHNQSVLLALLREPNATVFQKTLALSDWYFGAPDWPHPLGLVQMCAVAQGAQLRGATLPRWLGWLPQAPFEALAHHALTFWLSSEDLPRPGNRIGYDGERVVLALRANNQEPHRRLRRKLRAALAASGACARFAGSALCLSQDIGIEGTAHQAGIAVFGTDPAVSVLDPDCRAHELDNLYLADASCFPSVGAVNPTLTLIANALRVADHIGRRFGFASPP